MKGRNLLNENLGRKEKGIRRLLRGKKAIAITLSLSMLFSVFAPLPGVAYADTATAVAAAATTHVTLTTGQTLTLTNGSDYTLDNNSDTAITNAQIVVPNNVTATLRVPNKLTINDSGNGKSPITLSGNAKLTLIVDGTLSVYGGAAGDGENANPSKISAGGTAGKAAISVPTGTSLTLRGNGTVYAYGGDAGNGGSAGEIGVHNQAGAGGGGAGAGVGGDGGAGGHGVLNSSGPESSGGDGAAGVSAGTVMVYETAKLYAYGGNGGSGGQPVLDKGQGEIKSTSGSGGGGGYPAAGVGGGGAGAGGADHGDGGGGFSGGAGQQVYVRDAVNGMGGPAQEFAGGGGYFSKGDDGSYKADTSSKLIGGAIGGGHVYTVDWYTYSGQGGSAGSGGTVGQANTAKLYAYNGSATTTSKGIWGQNQTPIYWQNGYSLVSARAAGTVTTRAGVETVAYFNAARKLSYTNSLTNSNLGVGSGAGFTEHATDYEGDTIYLLGKVYVPEVVSNFLFLSGITGCSERLCPGAFSCIII